MPERDRRYAIIKPMYQEGRIKTFLDIFKYIPKTVVATDLRKKVSRFSAQLNHLESLVLTDLFLIGNLCDLTRTQMLKLLTHEFALRDNEAE